MDPTRRDRLAQAVASRRAFLAAVLAPAIAPVQPSAAAPPEPVDQIVDLPAGVGCPFPVELAFSGKAKQIDLPGGGTIMTGPGFRATLTNLADPVQQLSLSLTGAFHVTPLANGDLQLVATGRNLFRLPDLGLTLVSGRFTRVFDPQTGTAVTPLTGEGRQVALCPLLTAGAGQAALGTDGKARRGTQRR